MALNGAWNRRGLDYLIDFGHFSPKFIENNNISYGDWAGITQAERRKYYMDLKAPNQLSYSLLLDLNVHNQLFYSHMYLYMYMHVYMYICMYLF